MTQKIAKSLLTGMFTDTGSFMHSNTSESTLKAAGEMVSVGARTDKIHSFTYNKDISSLRAWALAMENTKIDEENKLVFSILTEEDINKIGELPDDAFTGFINFLQSVPECRVSMFMYQDGEYIKGSLRSEEDKNFNVSKLAKFFGGGGHKLASGFRVKGKVIKIDNGWRIE
jgi:phosphoesterase RecJ-like protein